MRREQLAEILEPSISLISPREKRTVTEWAEQVRRLSPLESSTPGRFRPIQYQRAIMNAGGDPEVQEIVLMCCSQGGKSECTRNILGYWVSDDPGPCLWVMPTNDDAEDAIRDRVRPMIENSIPWVLNGGRSEITKDGIKLATMHILPGSAEAPRTISNHPQRYAIGDEVDKWPRFSGKEGAPRELLKARLRTYEGISKLILVSTPTTADGAINQAFQSCADRRDFRLPCPHCAEFIEMKWPVVRWPAREEGEDQLDHADRIERDRLAYIECPHCRGAITESERRALIRSGRWFSTLGLDEDSFSLRVAFHFNALVSPWASIHKLAATWIKAQGSLDLLMAFITHELGEPFEQRINEDHGLKIELLAKPDYKPGVVPDWAGLVLAAADTQRDCFYWTVRAWGRNYRSRGIAHGKAYSFEELTRLTLEARWSIERSTQTMETSFLVIDSGGSTRHEDEASITDLVYQYAESDPSRIIPIKGHGGRAKPARLIDVRRIRAQDRGPGRQFNEVMLRILDTQSLKSILWNSLITEDQWEEHCAIDADYCAQMMSERQTPVRDGDQMFLMWQKKSGHAANHYWDTAVYQCAAARMAQVGSLPSREELIEERAAAAQLAQRIQQTERPTGISNPHGQSFLANWR